jgi:hypothetical protein
MKMKALMVGLLTGAMSLSAWAQQPKQNVVTEEQLQKITAAMPEKAPAQPQQARKVLVFNLCGPRGFVHDSIPHGTKAMQLLGEKTGAWTATVSNDPAVFEPESLKQFDAVVMVNTTADLFAAPPNATEEQKQAAKSREARLRESLLNFVNSGKGLAGIHAATDCFYNWADYGKMMGGYFDGHPWHEKVTLDIEDPKHPVNACFEGAGEFVITDEIYQFKDPYTRDALHILTSLNTAKTNMTKQGIKRTDGDFAVSWVRQSGQGRVFYCSIGHRQEIYWNPVILKHYLAGIQYALGDLKCDATPNGKKKVAVGGDEIGWFVLAAD